MPWVPNSEDVHHDGLLYLLAKYQSSYQCSGDELKAIADDILSSMDKNAVNLHLAYIFSLKTQENNEPLDAGIRFLAYKVLIVMLCATKPQPEEINLIMDLVLSIFNSQESDSTIKEAAGFIFIYIVNLFGVFVCRLHIDALARNLEVSGIAAETALNTLNLMCQQNTDNLIRVSEEWSVEEPHNQHLLNLIIPNAVKLIDLETNIETKIRSMELLCCFKGHESSTIKNYAETITETLLRVVCDESPKIKQYVCRTFSILLNSYTDKLTDLLKTVIECILTCESYFGSQSVVDVYSCWELMAKVKGARKRKIFEPYLLHIVPRIVDVLVDNNSEHWETKAYGVMQNISDDIEETARCHITRCLTELTRRYKSKVTDILFPLVRVRFDGGNLQLLESGIIALGAAAAGDIDQELLPGLPYLIESLNKFMSNENPYVRSAACWAVKFHFRLINKQLHQNPISQEFFYQSIMSALLSCIVVEKNQRVQKFAYTALSVLIKTTRPKNLCPFFPAIVNTLIQSLSLYKDTELVFVYITIDGFTNRVGFLLKNTDYGLTLIPLLEEKLKEIAPTDSSLPAFWSCLKSILKLLGTGNSVFTKDVFDKSLSLLVYILQPMSKKTAPLPPAWDNTFIVGILETLSVIIKGLDKDVKTYIEHSHFIEILRVCFAYGDSKDILFAAFKLMEDVMGVCFEILDQHLPYIIEELVNKITDNKDNTPDRKSKSILMIKTISDKYQEWQKQYSPGQKELHLNSKEKPDFLKESAYKAMVLMKQVFTMPYEAAQTPARDQDIVVIISAIGCLALLDPRNVATILDKESSHLWLSSVVHLEDSYEKSIILQGFFSALLLRPDLLGDNISIDQLNTSSNELKSLSNKVKLSQVIKSYTDN